MSFCWRKSKVRNEEGSLSDDVIPQESDIPVDDYSKGVVFYLSQEEKKRVVGVLTWNLFGKMDIAKQVWGVSGLGLGIVACYLLT